MGMLDDLHQGKHKGLRGKAIDAAVAQATGEAPSGDTHPREAKHSDFVNHRDAAPSQSDSGGGTWKAIKAVFGKFGD